MLDRATAAEIVRRLAPPNSPIGLSPLDARLGDHIIDNFVIFNESYNQSSHFEFLLRGNSFMRMGIGCGGYVRWSAAPGNEIIVRELDVFNIIATPAHPKLQVIIGAKATIRKSGKQIQVVETIKWNHGFAYWADTGAVNAKDAKKLK
jgi:hypothetical protein